MEKQRLISIVINAYNAQVALERQLVNWAQYPQTVREQLECVLVDDGSATPLVVDPAAVAPGLRVVLARIEQDIAWNMPGARNLGALLASSPFLLLHDIDHHMVSAAMERLVANADSLQRDSIYSFRRTHEGAETNIPVNCFLCSRDGFWRLGGYDEDFAGHYGREDRYFLDGWTNRIGDRILLNNVWFEVHPQFATQGLSRDTTRNTELYLHKTNEPSVRDVACTRLRFPWSMRVVCA